MPQKDVIDEIVRAGGSKDRHDPVRFLGKRDITPLYLIELISNE